MFTGIITGTGLIKNATPIENTSQKGGGLRLTIQTPTHYLDDVQQGDSIALNGACMTVTTLAASKNEFTIDISAESLACTVGLNQTGKQVNLEKAMRLEDRLGGHLVSGHVDGVGTVLKMEPTQESWTLEIMAPQEIGRFLAYKGSVTVNGVSLTVNTVKDIPNQGTQISINLIPHTVKNTTLGLLKTNTKVNLEIDLIARYVERMMFKN